MAPAAGSVGETNCGRKVMKKTMTFGLRRLMRSPFRYTDRTRSLGASAFSSNDEPRRIASTASQRRYAAPTIFSTVNAVADAARSADSPTATIVVWMRMPVDAPAAAANPARREWLIVFDRDSVMSGPGVIVSAMTAAL